MLFFASLLAVLVVICPSLASSNAIDDMLSLPKWGFSDLPGSTKSELQNLVSRKLSRCQLACTALSILLPSEHTAVGESDYSPLVYWSLIQQAVVPACRIDVNSAKSISTVVKISQLAQCPFNVKSGGHTAFAGGSNIQDGILINLGRLSSVTVSEDHKTVTVGPGQDWYDVYKVLDPLGISVVGGREAGVGVGGFLLGGGISYFAGRRGWGCDNVEEYEVILASGKIVKASSISNADLFWALRGGGGSNFGIVSSFKLSAFEQGSLWGGSRFYDISTSDALLKALENFNVAAPTDDFAHLYIAFAYAAQLGGFLGISGPAYGKPEPKAPIFSELEAVPSLIDATSIASMSELSVQLNETAVLREVMRTVSFKNSAALMAEVVKIYMEEASSVLDVKGLLPAMAFQPISLNIIKKMQKNSGNAIGLTADRGPLIILNMSWGWEDAADDERVYAATENLIKRSVAMAKKMKLDDPFIYMNYASIDASVYDGYGKQNLNRLKKIKGDYDSLNVFGKLWRGYFKL